MQLDLLASDSSAIPFICVHCGPPRVNLHEQTHFQMFVMQIRLGYRQQEVDVQSQVSKQKNCSLYLSEMFDIPH